MDEENKDKVRAKRTEIEKEIAQFKKDKEKELHEYCITMGGHFWWPWQRRYVEMFGPEYSYYENVRVCIVCKARESIRVEEGK